MLNKKDYKDFVGLAIGADVFIITGLIICLAQIITQWVVAGGVVSWIDWWTATVHMSYSVIVFVVYIVGVIAALALFVYDLISGIFYLKHQKN